MKVNCFFVLFITCFLFTLQGNGQNVPELQKYHAKLVTFDTIYEGDVSVNLFGENPETIKLEWRKVSEDNLRESIHRVQFEVSAISKLVINQDTFCFKNLEDDYKSTRPNYLVKKIYGNDVLGLYQFTPKEGEQEFFVGLIQRDPYYIKHPIFTSERNKLAITIPYFAGCRDLFEKMKSEKDGYWVKKGYKPEECMVIWKKIIDDYQMCASTKR
jgi:hypothetical protein